MTVLDEIGAGPAFGASPLAWRRRWLTIDKEPAALAFAQTVPGKALLVASLTVLLAAFSPFSLQATGLIAVTLCATTLLPAYRLPIMIGASTFYLFMKPMRHPTAQDFMQRVAAADPADLFAHPLVLQFTAVGLFLALAYGALELQRRHKPSYAAKRPVLAMSAGLVALLAVCLFLGRDGTLASLSWGLLTVWAAAFWYLAYGLSDQKTKDTTPNLYRAGFSRPFWVASVIPLGKGPAFLRKFEAKTAGDLAATQLKALKLGVWGALLFILFEATTALLQDGLHLPTLAEALAANVAGTPVALGERWFAVASNYFLDLLYIAFWGHMTIAVIRMTGYGIPRNTVNPLASRTLTEFWNRYFYYFKELLVDFFFYPTFMRAFKTNPRLRLAFATFCAAGLGNVYLHMIQRVHDLHAMDLWAYLLSFQTYLFYAVVLAAGLIVSQIRARKFEAEESVLKREILPRLGVIAFFCFLKIFDDVEGVATLGQHFSFITSLTGA